MLAGAENASVQDRGLGPGRYLGQGPGPGQRTEIIMGDSQGHARGLDLGSGDVHDPTRGHGPVLVLARCHAPDRGRGRAIEEVDTESALTDLAPEVGPRVAVAVGNARDGEREVARRMYVFYFLFNLCSGGLIWWPTAEREKGKEEKWDGIGRCFRRPMGKIRYH